MFCANEGELGEPSSKITQRNTKRVINTEISFAKASSMFPGFRFSPTDEELIQFYLRKKIQGCDVSVDQVIGELDICRHEPWDLPAEAIIPSEGEWFFFSPRGRKYSNSTQCKRATEFGYWKTTGKERNVKQGTNVIIGRRRTLVFHTGRAPKGARTEWIMNQYCTINKPEDGMVVCRLRKNKEFHSKQSCMLEGNEVEKSTSLQSNIEEEEDDCYADILKDDIIKLDDDEDHRPVIKMRSRMKNNAGQDKAGGAMPAFQGTTHRRIRLGGKKLQGPDFLSHQQRSFVAKLKYPSIFVFVLVLVFMLVILTIFSC